MSRVWEKIENVTHGLNTQRAVSDCSRSYQADKTLTRSYHIARRRMGGKAKGDIDCLCLDLWALVCSICVRPVPKTKTLLYFAEIKETNIRGKNKLTNCPKDLSPRRASEHFLESRTQVKNWRCQDEKWNTTLSYHYIPNSCRCSVANYTMSSGWS